MLEKIICIEVARIYAGKDWHKLSPEEKKMIPLLEMCKYILPTNQPNGFVGKVNPNM